ncbi:MAG: cell division protein FtsL [Bdellovibrionales bacterium]|nr:cell division protein FtsL [Bdellovibrionales bacterium]
MKRTIENVKPFMSVLFILLTLFGLVFVKMENRRMGYAILNLAHKEKKAREQQRLKLVQVAKMTSPERIRKIATSRLTFQSAKEGQVIRIAGSGSVVIK